MQVAIPVVLVVLVLAGLVVAAARGSIRLGRQRRTEVAESDDSLRYAVPNGQDPAPLLGALNTAGYTSTVEDDGATQLLVIACPDGAGGARERVRSVVASTYRGLDTHSPAPGTVRFVDE